MKVKIELKANWRMTLSFEFQQGVLSLAQRVCLTDRMRDASAKFAPAPVSLLSLYEITHMWNSGNGAHVMRDKVIGSVHKLDYAKVSLEHEGNTWLSAEVDLIQNPSVLNRLAQCSLSDPDDPTWPVRNDFAVFPRMMVNTIPESQPRMGEQHRQIQFSSYGPILGLDCVYGAERRKTYQSISDANYIKKHHLDLPK